MDFGVKRPTPLSDEARITWDRVKFDLAKLPEDQTDNDLSPYVYFYNCKRIERMAGMPNQPACRNCGAGYDETSTKDQGKYICPLCGQENHWRKVVRFVMI